MVARQETHPGTGRAPSPAEFRVAVEQHACRPVRPEVLLRGDAGAAADRPVAAALSADVTVDEVDLGTGRIILLHDPAGNDAWDGTFRCVAYARAEIDPELDHRPDARPRSAGPG